MDMLISRQTTRFSGDQHTTCGSL